MLTTILGVLCLLAGFGSQAVAQTQSRPLLLIFETNAGTGVDKNLASATTRALRDYFRETQRVEVTVFNRESPTVLRAIMEKMLTPDKVASYASQEERVEVARILGFNYAAGAEISVKTLKVKPVGPSLLEVLPSPQNESNQAHDQPSSKSAGAPSADSDQSAEAAVVQVKLWVARVGGGKGDRWEVVKSSQAVGTKSLDLQNAMQSAASAAVLEITRTAFAQLPRISQLSPATGTESIAIGADQPPVVSPPTASDYATRAQQSLEAGNLALAIEQFRRAVDADPNDTTIRLKLAEAYARKGMFNEAQYELDRARLLGTDEKILAEVEEHIQKLRSTQTKAVAEAAQPKSRISLTGPKGPKVAGASAVAKMIEGDKLWKEGKPDEAAEAYKEATKLDPSDWRAYERLAIVNASMSLFGESRKALQQLAMVQTDPPSDVVSRRYEILKGYFDTFFNSLVRQYETAAADFEKKIINRESYYNTIKGIALRLELMAGFLEYLQAPPLKKPAHLRRSLACGLMVQAAANLLDYLETNSSTSKSNAQIFASQAKIEIQGASMLEENKIVIETQTQSAGDGEGQGSSTSDFEYVEQPTTSSVQ
ncbi:MAG: tetratricopeptide repeat protein [Armatimonadota bacterium]